MEDKSLHYLLMAGHSMLQKKFFSDIKEQGLSPGQPKVLDYLKDNDGAVQKDIAKGCYIEPASLSALLAGMEKKGVITRRMKENNRRNINVYLTEKGRSMCKIITKSFADIEEKAMSDFSNEEKKMINIYLEKILKGLEAK